MKAETKAKIQELKIKYKDAKAKAERLTQDQKDKIKLAISTALASNGRFSWANFMLVSMEAKARGFDSVPYLEIKTFKGWLKYGYRVKKGEKCIYSITFVLYKDGKKLTGAELDSVDFADEEQRKGVRLYPRLTYLFAKEQVESIKRKEVK